MTRTAGFILIILFTVPLAAAINPQNVPTPHPVRGFQLESIAWTDCGAEFLDKRRFKTALTRKEKATDRLALLDHACEQAGESGKLVLWYVHKISERTKRGRQMIRAPVQDIAMRQIVWSEPRVERIVKRHFVPLRMVCDEPLAEKYKLRPLAFLEPAVVIIRPDGTVAHVTSCMRTMDASWFAQLLRDVLRMEKGPLKSARLDDALDRGEWVAAVELAVRDGLADPAAFLRLARLQRLARDGEAALMLLDWARSAWEGQLETAVIGMTEVQRRAFEAGARGRGRRPARGARDLSETRASLDAEEGVVLARLGRFSEAKPLLMKTADTRTHPRAAEAAYLLAMIRLHGGDEIGATRRFQEIVQDHPGSLYARRARANLVLGIDDNRPVGAAFAGLQRITWLPPEAYDSYLPADTAWTRAQISPEAAAERGIRFLLRQQRADGGWNDSRYSYCPDPRITPNVWVSVTALACRALHRFREGAPADLTEAIDDAIRRGERYLADAANLNRGRNEDVYADAYRLEYYADRLQSLKGETAKTRLRNAMRDVIRAAGLRQDERGFWAHEYANAFCTAVMAQGLLAARQAGVMVPETVLRKAASAIKAARFEDGSYSYGGRARRKPSKESLKNSSTRMPLCESVLFELKASGPDQLGVAMANFWNYWDRIAGVRRTDFHSDGQVAGFMFFHTLFHTARAMESLPPSQRREQKALLLDKVLQCAEMDGTFQDSHEVGRSYGTAMALITISLCLEADER